MRVQSHVLLGPFQPWRADPITGVVCVVLINDSHEIYCPGKPTMQWLRVCEQKGNNREDSEINTVHIYLIVFRNLFSQLLPFLIFSNLHSLQSFGPRYLGMRRKTYINVYIKIHIYKYMCEYVLYDIKCIYEYKMFMYQVIGSFQSIPFFL